jgi:hypothetical protein
MFNITVNTISVILVKKSLVVIGWLFNTTFNNLSVILWRSVLLVEETGVPGENH